MTRCATFSTISFLRHSSKSRCGPFFLAFFDCYLCSFNSSFSFYSYRHLWTVKAVFLVPSIVFSFEIRNLRMFYMWYSFLMTRFTSPLPICKVRHSQDRKGEFNLAYRSLKRFMCFRSIQNLDAIPPNTKPVISSKRQDAVDFSYLKLESCVHKSSNRKSLFRSSVFFFRKMDYPRMS